MGPAQGAQGIARAGGHGLGFDEDAGAQLGTIQGEMAQLRGVVERMSLKGERHGKKADGKKRKKKKKRSGSRSSGASSSSDVSMKSDSDEEAQPGKKYVQWLPKGHEKKKFKPEVVTRAECMHFKKRKDLLAFSQKYPGGLAGHFLHQVRRKMMLPSPSNSHELLATDPCGWAASNSELKDVRDLKEVQFLARLMSEVSLGRLPQAMDLCAMRVREVRMAKAASGSWEKAAAISLQACPLPSNTALPDGAFTL
jgi:hypothetical protein